MNVNLGIDIGSTTVKIAVVRAGEIIYKRYERHFSKVREKAVELVRGARAIIGGDAKLLTKAQGIGKKIAERIVLELKDKLAKGAPDLPSGGGLPAAETSADSEAVNALLVLGYSKNDALEAIGRFDTTGMSLEEIIKNALKQLMK